MFCYLTHDGVLLVFTYHVIDIIGNDSKNSYGKLLVYKFNKEQKDQNVSVDNKEHICELIMEDQAEQTQ